MCVSILDSHSACISFCLNVCFHTGLPQCLYIQLFECGRACTLYILMCECVSMLDSHIACISSCVNVCFHAGLPHSVYILLCECVFPCWTPTELLYPLM